MFRQSLICFTVIIIFLYVRSKKKLVDKIMELGLCQDRSKLGKVSNEQYLFLYHWSDTHSVAEPRFIGWSRSRFKILAGAYILRSAPAPFLASEKRNDLKMFIVYCTYFFNKK